MLILIGILAAVGAAMLALSLGADRPTQPDRSRRDSLGGSRPRNRRGRDILWRCRTLTEYIKVQAYEWEGGWSLDIDGVGVEYEQPIGTTQHAAGDDPEPVIREYVEMSGFNGSLPIRATYYFMGSDYTQSREWPARDHAPDPVHSTRWLLTRLIQVGLIAVALLIIWAVLESSERYW